MWTMRYPRRAAFVWAVPLPLASQFFLLGPRARLIDLLKDRTASSSPIGADSTET